MQTFNHLITTRPHTVRQVLISDLHLSPDEPALVQAFLAFIDDCIALPALKRLFILGDWFEVWLGDDAYLSLSDDARKSHWLTPIIAKLKQLRVNGCDVLVMHGNRDFLLGQPFCSLFGGTLIDEPYTLQVGDKRFRLEHGDRLCTDDQKYQFFRKIMRNRFTKWYLLNKPLDKRLEIAANIRKKSKEGNVKKNPFIMDVNERAVNKAIYRFDALLHGHTHRPEVHRSDQGKTRYVLSDWRVLDADTRKPKVSAIIGVITIDIATTDTAITDIGTDIDSKTNQAEFDLIDFKYLIQ